MNIYLRPQFWTKPMGLWIENDLQVRPKCPSAPKLTGTQMPTSLALNFESKQNMWLNCTALYATHTFYNWTSLHYTYRTDSLHRPMPCASWFKSYSSINKNSNQGIAAPVLIWSQKRVYINCSPGMPTQPPGLGFSQFSNFSKVTSTNFVEKPLFLTIRIASNTS